MAETVESLSRAVADLQRQVRDLRDELSSTLGRPGRPVKKILLSDTETGSVAELDYDSVADAVRVTRVR